ncbi:hypothetical protein ACC733_38915, partial [Rhizobium johnstonii]
YIHALDVRQSSLLLFVSGTMGLDQQGMAAADLEVQLELIWFNLRAIKGVHAALDGAALGKPLLALVHVEAAGWGKS